MPTSLADGITRESGNRSCAKGDTVDVSLAAKILNVAETTIQNYLQQGVLTAVAASPTLIAMRDLRTVFEVTHHLDLATVARTALRALVAASQLEQRLERVERMLGVTSTALDSTLEGARTFYDSCDHVRREGVEAFNAQQVLNLAYQFTSVTEEYLHMMLLATGDEEPWVVLMEAAQRLVADAPREQFRLRKDLECAYGYLFASRVHLRQVAYFFIRAKKGARIANAVFPETTEGDRDTQVINLILSATKPHL